MDATTTSAPETTLELPVNPIPVDLNEDNEADSSPLESEASLDVVGTSSEPEQAEVAVNTILEPPKKERRFFEPSQPLCGSPVRGETKESTTIEKEEQEVGPAAVNNATQEVTVHSVEKTGTNQRHLEDGNSNTPSIHRAAALFPMLGEDELLKLAEDIKENGLQHPIIRFHGEILDGRNRLAACKMAGVDPTFEEYSGETPVAFIMSVNVCRRQLEKSQLAALAVEMAPFLAEEAKKRQQGGVSVKVGEGGKTLEKAAEKMNVSTALTEKAKKVKKASPDKFAEILAGNKTVSRAQREIIQKSVTTSPALNTRGAVEIKDTDTLKPKNNVEENAEPPISQINKVVVPVLTPEQSAQVIWVMNEVGVDPNLCEALSAQGGVIRLTARVLEEISHNLDDKSAEPEIPMEVTHV